MIEYKGFKYTAYDLFKTIRENIGRPLLIEMSDNFYIGLLIRYPKEFKDIALIGTYNPDLCWCVIDMDTGEIIEECMY
ncbi:hypothetical protein Grass_240 [Bacillus phage Grass]|uniref:Uncharacterized protein n=1 Tax=Bacillus phage Grass TaxID=1406785 RepID=U5PUA1_BPGRA|nr:hypothetical protein Grass_240 [Bacillus phage Grass]AGY47505.1 hypothetical protein Grass_240 [Bacillus phage Grass]